MADQIVSWGGFNSKGTSGMGVTGSFQFSSSANSFFVGGGSVGVDTTSPTQKLDVVGSAADGIIRVAGPYSDIQLINKNSPYNTGDWKPAINFLENGIFQSSISYGDSFEFGAGITTNQGITANSATLNSGTLNLYGGGQTITFTDTVFGVTRGSIELTNTGAPFTYNMNVGTNSGAINFRTQGANTRLSIAQAGGVTITGGGTTSSTTSLLVQNANASSSLSIKDNGDSTFFYPGVAGYSLKISGSYSGNGASAIYETLGATGGYYGIHEFRAGTNTANAVRAMSIVYGGRVVIGNKSDTVLQHPRANLFVDTNVINTFNNSTQAFNTGIIINPSGSLNTQFTASGIQFNFAANNPNDTNGGAFVGSQYNPATNGYDTDLVIYNSQHTAGSYVETARFVGKSKSLSLGAGRNPSASLHISGSSSSALLKIDSPAVNNILYVSGSGNVGIGTSSPTELLTVGSSGKIGLLSPASGQTTTIDVNGYQGLNILTGPNSTQGIIINGYGSGPNSLSATNSGNNTIRNYVITYRGGSGKGVLIDPISTSVGESTASLQVKGSGTTSSTTSLLVQNANASSSLQVLDDGQVRVPFNRITNTSTQTIFYGAGSAIWMGLIPTGTNEVPSLYDQNSNKVIIGNKSYATNVNAGIIAIGMNHVNDDRGTYNQIVIGNNSSTGANGGYRSDYNIVLGHSSGQKININGDANTGNNIVIGNFSLSSSLDNSMTNTTVIGNSIQYSGSNSVVFEPSQNVYIGTPLSSTYKLNVSGSGNFTNNLTVTGSVSTSSAALSIYKSGSTVLDIQGSSGQLFSVTDSLSGSLFSVNTVAGLPVIEAFSNNVVNIGKYGAYGLVVSGSDVAVATGSSAPTGTPQEGTFKFVASGGSYYIYAYIGGAWRSGSLA